MASRRQDWAPRSVRRFDREVATAARSFRAMRGREPDDEVGEVLGVTESRVPQVHTGIERLQGHDDALSLLDA